MPAWLLAVSLSSRLTVTLFVLDSNRLLSATKVVVLLRDWLFCKVGLVLARHLLVILIRTSICVLPGSHRVVALAQSLGHVQHLTDAGNLLFAVVVI